jgi:4-amino-4-deoxy-L-arabinose transferase-like glycosyltransferase
MGNAAIEQSRFPGWFHLAAITTLAALLFALRLTAPPNLLDQDQERPGTYVLDVVKNGNWLCQRDLNGEITSKPPLYTWYASLIALARGRVDEFALYLPGALSAWGTAWLILAVGRIHFGARAAFFAALASLICTAGVKECGLARTDGVFAFTVTATAFLGFRAWTQGKAWAWFWVMAAVATLAKGPLGLILAGGGVIAALWERKSGAPLSFKGNQLLGIGLFLFITIGWFLLAYHSAGKSFIDKIVGKELVGHTVSDARYHIPGSLFYQPSLYYLGRAAPWSLFGIYGLWRVWRNPTAEGVVRRFERFLFCWFLFGLVIFSVASHQRGDLLWPIMPAAALLAGRELDRLSRRATRVFDITIAAATIVMIGGFIYYYFGPHARSSIVRQTVALNHVAAEVRRYGGSQFPLTHLDNPIGLQIYLNTWRPRVSAEHAAALLRGPEPVFVAVNDVKKLEAVRKLEDPPIFTVMPSMDNESYPVRIISNRQVLESTNSFAFGFGDLTVRASGVRLEDATEKEFRFSQGPKTSEVTIVNESAEPRRVRVRVHGDGPPHREERHLAGHEIWKMRFFAINTVQTHD